MELGPLEQQSLPSRECLAWDSMGTIQGLRSIVQVGQPQTARLKCWPEAAQQQRNKTLYHKKNAQDKHSETGVSTVHPPFPPTEGICWTYSCLWGQVTNCVIFPVIPANMLHSVDISPGQKGHCQWDTTRRPSGTTEGSRWGEESLIQHEIHSHNQTWPVNIDYPHLHGPYCKRLLLGFIRWDLDIRSYPKITNLDCLRVLC